MMRFTIRALAVSAMTAMWTGSAFAQLKPETFLARQPVQPGVMVSNPPASEVPACKANEVTWPNSNARAVLVTDGNGKKLRQFIDTRGGNNYNIVSYFLDGVESYREVDSNGNGKPDQYRWLGVNGSKRGVDLNEDGIIDEWQAITPEEVGHELYLAIATKDVRRLSALLITKNELAYLKVTPEEEAKLLKKAEGAAARLTATIQGLNLNEKARFMHAQFTHPFAVAADTFGGADDLVKHKNGVIFIDKQDGQPLVMVSIGELVQVGRAWKVVEGPTVGGPSHVEDDPTVPRVPKAIEEFVKKLGTEVKLPANGSPAEMVRYHMERAALLEQCARGTQGTDQHPWLKQLIDAYQATVEADPAQKTAYEALKVWHGAIVKTPGAEEMHAYVSFRLMAAEFAIRVKEAKGQDVLKVQNEYREQLELFVKTYPRCSDAPEAMNRLAVANEFAGTKEAEDKARGWYERIAQEFPSHPYAAKAKGAVLRLTSEGTQLLLTGSDFTGKPFSVASLGGKPAIVFYWATWAPNTAEKLKELAVIAGQHQAKGIQIVTCCLDEDTGIDQAQKMLQEANLPGFHLIAKGGIEKSPLATAYGIQSIPHVMIVEKDGKIVNKNVQTSLADEIAKLK